MQNATSLPRRFLTSSTVYSDAGSKTQGIDQFMHTSQATQCVIGEHQSRCTLCRMLHALDASHSESTKYPTHGLESVHGFETAQVTCTMQQAPS